MQQIKVQCDNKTIWADEAGTEIHGDQVLVDAAWDAALTGTEVTIGGLITVKAGTETPLQVTAALCAADPGRAVVKEAPSEVFEALAQAGEEHDCNFQDMT